MSDSITPSPETISIMIDPNHLSTARDNGLIHLNWLQLFNPFRGKQRVHVEAVPYLSKDSVFYVPFRTPFQQPNNVTPTQFIQVSSKSTNNLVRKGDKFEVSFAGMSITPQDAGISRKNELLLYSVTNDQDDEEKDDDDDQPRTNAKGKNFHKLKAKSKPVATSTSDPKTSIRTLEGKPAVAPMAIQTKKHSSSFVNSLAAGLPYIHYDPVFDAPSGGDEPDTYVPIPASKSLFHRTTASTDPLNRLFIKFRVMELDAEAEAQLQAMSQLDDLSSTVGFAKKAIPHYQAVSGALQVASSMGKHSLKQFSKPDHVFSKDVEFKIAGKRLDENTEQLDNFLRYGYYFFLNKKVDAKLYSQTNSSQNMPLLLHRMINERERKRGLLEYFPLAGVSYVVVKVSKSSEKDPPADWDRIRLIHKHRLDRMLTMTEMKGIMSDKPTKKKK